MEGNTSQNAGTAQQTGAAGNNAANEAMEALITSVIQKQLDPLHARITRFEKAAKTATVSESATDGEPETLTAKVAKLTKTLADKDAAEVRARRSKSIEDAIRGKGIEGTGFDDALAAVLHYHGDAIKVKGDKTIYEDPETGVEMPVGEFLDKKFLTGARKDRYTSTTPKGGGKIDRPGPRHTSEKPFYHELTADERAKMTPRERQAYAADDYRRAKQQ